MAEPEPPRIGRQGLAHPADQHRLAVLLVELRHPSVVGDGNRPRLLGDDDDEGVRLFTLSAEQDDDLGQLWLGYCYQNGFGVDRDAAEARYWYRLSAAQGNASAKKRLQEF